MNQSTVLGRRGTPSGTLLSRQGRGQLRAVAGVLAAPPQVASPSSKTVQRRSAPVARSSGGSTSLVAMPAVKLTEQLKEQEALMPLPRNVEGVADDPSVHNPLQRHERLGTGWFGVIMEHDGVLFQDTWELHTQAWLRVSQELGHSKPLGHLFRRVRGLRDDVVVSTVFNWTQNPSTAKMIAARKAEVYEELLEGRQPPVMLEARPFLETIRRYNIPVALSCALPERRVREGLARSGLQQHFDVVVTAEDGGATEVEWYFMYAGQQIQRPPMRCIVIGQSNTTVEAAHELGMKCVVLSGNNPVYNFSSADLVVRDLSQLTFLNLKKLFGQEGLVEPRLGAEESGMEARYDAGGFGGARGLEFGDDDFDDEDDMADDMGLSSMRRGAAYYRLAVMADRQLVLHSGAGGQLVLRHADPEKEEAEQKKRIEEALVLEEKLRMINETIPTRVYNTSSSSAGAGSGDFHQYRMVRRAEQLRVKRLDEDFKKKQEAEEYEARKREREQQAEEATAKRRKKRLKKKEKKQKKAGANAGAGAGAGGAQPGDNKESSSDSEDEQKADLD